MSTTIPRRRGSVKPRRKESSPLDWDLKDIIQDEARAEALLKEKAEAYLALLTRFPEHARPRDAEQAFRMQEELLLLTSRLTLYFELRLSENVHDAHARATRSRIDILLRRIEREEDRLTAWIIQQDEAMLKPLLNGRYGRIVRRVLERKQHILPLQVEQALSSVHDQPLPDVFDTLHDSMTKPFLGREQPLSVIRSYVHHPEPSLREAAYTALLQAYEELTPVSRVIMHEHALSVWRERVLLRKYQHVRQPVLVKEGVRDASYKALLASIRRAFPLFNRASRVKHAILSQRKPYTYARKHHYATHPILSLKTIPLHEALSMIRTTFNRLEGFSMLAERVLKHAHASLQPREGKYGGAFCADNPRQIPYLLMNYTGTIQDVLTLAHELGHCVHDQLIHPDIPLQERHPPLTLAEIASTTMEGLVLDDLARRAKGEERLALLLLMLDEWQATVARQAVFSMMEDELYTRLPEGIPITRLSQTYQRVLERLYPGMQGLDEFKDEWLHIPHLYHQPYYVFTYSWTFLTSRMIIKTLRTKQGGERFKTLLSKGGSIRGEEALGMLGWQANRSFWTEAISELEDLITRVEREAERLGYTL